MIKVIAALDGLNVSKSTIDYAVYLSKNFDAHIVPTFIEDVLYHGKNTEQLRNEYEDNDWAGIETFTKKKEIVQKESIEKVEEQLKAESVQFNIRKDRYFALQSLIKESQFADLILIDENDRFSDWDRSKPSHFLKNLMAETDCPLLIVPGNFKPIEKIVFAYDGSPSSLYAMRLFSYLFRTAQVNEVETLMVTDSKHSNHLPDHHLLKELLKRKYSRVNYTVIKTTDDAEGISGYLNSQTLNCIVVVGAYRRSSFSRWLRQSHADILLSELNIPLFIAHK